MPNIGQSPLSFPVILGDWRRANEFVFIGSLRVIRDQVTTIGETGLFFERRMGGRLAVNDALKAMSR